MIARRLPFCRVMSYQKLSGDKVRATVDLKGALCGTVVRSLIAVTCGLVTSVCSLIIPAEPVFGKPISAPSSPRGERWHLQHMNAQAAWRYAMGAKVIVAVIDSGVDATHPDLVGQVLPGADFVKGSFTDGRVDPVGHGTAVASLIAGRATTNPGVRGLAPRSKILPVRVLDDHNKYDDASVVAQGLRWAVDHGASIINLSLGGHLSSESLAQAIAYAASHQVIVIACTGNVSSSESDDPQSRARPEIWYPAREQGVIAVAGLTDDLGGAQTAGAADQRRDRSLGSGGSEALWTGSITGPQTVLTAPAVNLTGARPGGYWRVQGTSFATSLVSATAALLRSRWPNLSAANVINRLIRSAKDLGSPGRDDQYGYGEINPLAALTLSIPPVETNPLITDSMTLTQMTEVPAVAYPKPVMATSSPHGGNTMMTLISSIAASIILMIIAVLGFRRTYAIVTTARRSHTTLRSRPLSPCQPRCGR